MELVPLDEGGRLYLSPAIDDWETIRNNGITAVIDLDGDVDLGIPTIPNQMLYIYFPIYDDELPDTEKLHAVAKLAAGLVERGERVLSHCGLGLNRSALVAGLTLTYLGMSGKEAVRLLREKRPGALFNENFANYLQSLESNDTKSQGSGETGS
ncbi:MAG: dual specificity protein phosphatase family protein [Acidobacteriia bacterium]|nr:dual specificity protein phosphatase family protein [Terriglobia bacterium]